ncbi:MAG: hypothetical protein IJ157_03025 [Clostridia bacterium]|nr:hypothetical protein [Clostridia bacterium]
MEQPLIVLKAQYNRKNRSQCELYADRVELSTFSESRLMPVYGNKTRVIPLKDIRRVVISSGGMGFFAKHPNAIHFIVGDASRTLDDMLRDQRFHSADYIDEGVQQFCPDSQADLTEKLAVAARIKDYIERWKEADGRR